MLNRSLAPDIQKVFRVNFQHVDQEQLTNGATMSSIVAGDQPVVKLEVVFTAAGNRFENLKGQASMAVRMLKEGTTSYTSVQITNLFSRLGAYIEINPGFDNASVSIYCLDKHFEQISSILFEMIDYPSFDENELELQKELQTAQLQIQNKKNNILASKSIRQAIFGFDHAYGRINSEQDIKTFTPEHLRNFWGRSKNSFEVLVSGRPSENTLKVIKDFFSAKNLAQHKEESILVPSLPFETPSNESVQASIRMGKKTLRKEDQDYLSLLITNHLLGGFFGSRLMKNIREDKGLTYGISSSLVPLQESAYWVIGAEVNTDNVDRALKEIHYEIERLTEFNNEEELETAKTHMVGSFQAELNSPFAIMDRFKSIHLHGLDYSYYDKLFDTIASFRPSDLRNITTRYLTTDDLKRIVIN